MKQKAKPKKPATKKISVEVSTTTQPRKRGRGQIRGEDGKHFSKEYQPTSEMKRAGWAKKKFSRNMLKEMLDLPYKFAPESALKEQLRKAFGDGIEEMTVGQVMALMQLNKAVLKADTNAFGMLINQAFGFPKQQTDVDLSSKGNPVGYTPPTFQITVRGSDTPIAESEDQIAE